MTDYITIAMPKGRIFYDACHLLREAGFDLPNEFETTRKLILTIENSNFRFILAKPVDVATYVEYGVADIGIAGKDVILESQRNVYEMLDLGISACRMAVAGLPSRKQQSSVTKVATKYPKIATEYFKKQGKQVDIISLNGSIELAPLIGLSDYIVDIVSTGQTLRENGLVELTKIMEITSRLIVNPVSYRLKKKSIDYIIEKLKPIVEVTGVGMD
ncbi:ATP phosphoribosyltransferase [Terrilactibacillus laevilacticus]|uniref:ATP phosphoribosyltransferase n=1 Tax=Terrilactibacillus laevilacticus TaxID=1380157 RepID=A0ABW5PTL7_9BACI|nr:ATP phosphoribosyltransferase [Terrilactibacillus laevilacticus]